MWNISLAFSFAVMVACTIAANLLLKVGAAPGEPALGGLVSPKSALGAVVFGCALVLYMRVLKSVPLNLAQAFMAVQYIGVILAAAVLLNEPLPPIRWAGMFLIALGIALVGWTAHLDTQR